ncbi:MAG: class I SAM-dependent methyltransferase [Acidimicrobiia bacterium]
MTGCEPSIDPSNAAQARAWNGAEGSYWAANADHFDRCVAAHHRQFMAAAAVRPGERILDVGCGTGQVTREAARATAGGEALGVDLSAAMIELARSRAQQEGTTNARFVQADAQIHPFDAASFDAILSRTGAMFFGDPVAALRNLNSALRPGGRLVLLTWASPTDNPWFVELSACLRLGLPPAAPPAGTPGPFALAAPAAIRELLHATGFTHIDLRSGRSPMWFGDDPEDATRFVSGLLGWMLSDHTAEARAMALAALRASIEAHHTDHGVLYQSTTWTIRASRPQSDSM